MAGSALGFTLGDATDSILNTYTADPTVLIAGTDRSASVLSGDCQLTLALSQPGMLHITAYASGWTPAKGQAIEIRDDGASGSVAWFAGTITAVSRRIETATTRLLYSITAQDYRWLLDRYDTVTGWWASKGINTILRDVLASHTNGGFTVGYAPASLGTLDRFEAVNERVTSVIQRLADAAGAYWEVDVYKRVNIFTTPAHKSAGTVTVDNTSNNVSEFAWSDDLTDIATRARLVAAGTTTRAVTAASETGYVYVYDQTQFSGSGGDAYLGTDLITYVSTTTVTGSEALVGISGVTQDWPIGTSVRPVIEADDSSAQTALATLLGGSLSGIAVRAEDASSLTRSEATAKASAILDFYSAGVSQLSGVLVDGRHDDAQHAWPGASVSVTLTSPVTVSGTWRIQSVTFTPRGLVGGGTRWVRQIAAGPVARGTELVDLLETL